MQEKEATEAINKGVDIYPSLTILSGPDEGLNIALSGQEQVLGRSRRSATILLEDTSVSRVHARITNKAGQYFVTDLESRNGIALNGMRIKPDTETPLKHLDQIKVGIYILRFNAHKPTAEESAKAPVYSDTPLPKKVETPVSFDEITISDKVPEDKPADLPPKPEDKKDAAEVKEDGLDKKIAEEQEAQKEVKGAEEILDTLPEQEPQELAPEGQMPAEEGFGKGIKSAFIVICVISILSGLIYYFTSQDSTAVKEKDKDLLVLDEEETPPAEPLAPGPADLDKHVVPEEIMPPVADEPIKNDAPIDAPVEATVDPAPSPAISDPLPAAPVITSPPAGEHVMSFILDLQTQPMPARISFNDQDLGMAPIKVPLQLKPGVSYGVVANFDLPDLNDQYQYRASFTPEATQEVVSLTLTPDIGTIKVMMLPRDVDFYMEGYYAYDKDKAHPVKLSNIIYGKPVYVPFGRYVIELKEKVKVGDTDTFVNEVRYHREVDINAETRLVELSIKDRELQFFPARINSQPSGALVFLDGKNIGKTPFAGEMPLGRHPLKLTLDGYFDNETILDMRVNSPYEATIEMKTSKVGQLIAKARGEKQNAQYADAINNLIEALKLGGSDKEKADIRILMGDCYYLMGDYDRALGFYEEMATDSVYRYKALLGKSRILNIKGDKQASMRGLAEIFLNVPARDPLSGDAVTLFRQISPLKSVMYIASEPKGATVVVNGKDMGEKTPVLLFDLSLGNYRIELSKPGYQSAQVQKNLKISEFVPVVVTLKPDSL